MLDIKNNSIKSTNTLMTVDMLQSSLLHSLDYRNKV